jgi:hypothetical protein
MRARALTAVAAAAATVLLPAAPAHAHVPLISSGTAGPVELLTFSGGMESWSGEPSDVSEASVECEPLTRGRRAVFAGALAWASDDRPGSGNDWSYVRVVAGAADDVGQVLTGEMSPFYVAYDDQPTTLPAVGVILPDDSVTYTPVLMVQVFDSRYDLVGTSMVAGQNGAWRGDGDTWRVARADLVRCGT